MYKLLVNSILQIATKDGAVSCDVSSIVIEFESLGAAHEAMMRINQQPKGAFIQQALLLGAQPDCAIAH